MSLFSLLKGKTKPVAPAPLNAMSAIQAHINWKVRLIQYTRGDYPHALDPAIICQDNQCELGRWLYGDGKNQGHDEHMPELINEHRLFHVLAAEIVKLVDAKQIERAEKILETPYSDSSRRVIRLLTAMGLQLQKKKEERQSGSVGVPEKSSD